MQTASDIGDSRVQEDVARQGLIIDFANRGHPTQPTGEMRQFGGVTVPVCAAWQECGLGAAIRSVVRNFNTTFGPCTTVVQMAAVSGSLATACWV